MLSQLKLLLIEDSPNDSDLLLRHLKKADVTPQVKRVETIADLELALSEGGIEWDAVICDYSLPLFNAIDAISIIRVKRPGIPCIVVSGSVGEEKAIETMRAGASDYLMKDNLIRLVPVLFREVKEKKQRKTIEENLKKSEEGLRQAQKLESIGQLAGGIAHDFNNLLATILIQSELIKAGLVKDKPVDKLIEHVDKGIDQIIKSSERATNLTRQLLAFSRKQILKAKVVDLNHLIADIENMLRRVIEENIEFKSELAKDLKNICIDPVHLEQILMNLVVNSRDAMPGGGKLTLETNNTVVDDEMARNFNIVAGPYVLLSVTDTGAGMSKEVKEHLFEPFYTTKPVGKGTGLGLSTVYGIVKQNNGLIVVESELGRGTTFKIFFPVTKADVKVVKVDRAVQTIGGTETILIVEDENDLRELICQTLAGRGYKVLNARNGVEALAYVKATQEPIHLVITDVVMPLMSGTELAKHVHEIHTDAKFLFQSGYAQEALQKSGVDASLVHLLTKPYQIKELLSKIRQILD